ncbi:hypothetical protein RBWH47_02331 [Rhodopirellula baltica WH47]|nr:hypothetical protein RBWH47_02331 [Rhodopirellula baltica WH47]
MFWNTGGGYAGPDVQAAVCRNTFIFPIQSRVGDLGAVRMIAIV